MLKGINNISLDAKGRFAVPTRYREELMASCEGKLVVTIDRDHCLLIYPQPEWQEIERKINKLPNFNKRARSLQRLLVGHATEIDMDGNGRMLLTTPLRKFAGLEKHAVLIGQGNKLELWDETRWEQKRDQWLEENDLDGDDLPPELESLSL